MPMSYSQIAAGLDISKQMVGKLARRGMPLGSVEEARAWRKANLNPAQRKPAADAVDVPERVASDETFDQARTREKIAEADRAEMESAKMRGDLIATEDVARQWATEASRQREAWLQFADRLAPLLEMRPLAFIRQTLDAEVRQILNGLAA